jgi:TnpA family transposase
MWELKSGDLCIEGAEQFSDYRAQLISWQEYEQTVADYGEQVGLPVAGHAFIEHARAWLEAAAEAADAAFPTNAAVRLENGEPVLSRLERSAVPGELKVLEPLIRERMDPINILDVLADTEIWLHWTRFFGPLSGHDAKIEEARARYVTTTFCYGCGLGPTQTARSLKSLDRRQVAWINQRHVTEAKLQEAITALINAYNRFTLPKLWGSGKHASADGTKWDVYEQNLLSEYHIRYGGYGGIGYYHVSDTYVALFSHFIPCGVWEAVYILDGLLNNTSDIQPDTLHADTQGQSAPVFGLAYLLGIELMPRIRNWKDLKLFRPRRGARYAHIDDLFSEAIDWDLIQRHLPDMLRVVLSIRAGRISAPTLLRKLGTYSRKNKLYFAFREIGRVVRTGFLLRYLTDSELRRTIQVATNKSEAFNNFVKWVAFARDATIAENDRDEQRKLIKYNHLVANCLIFHNVHALTRLLHQLAREGHDLPDEALAHLSPYLTEHINRFGDYRLDLDRSVPLPDYTLNVRPFQLTP